MLGQQRLGPLDSHCLGWFVEQIGEIRVRLEVSGLGSLHQRVQSDGRQTLAEFDFAFEPAVERSRIDTLATGA